MRGGGASERKARRWAAVGCASLLAVAVTVPLAAAEVGDLDPGFGADGLVALPSGDRYDAMDAPLVQTSGRVVFAGLLRNASGRVFLEGVTAAGTSDPTFGVGGELHTNSLAPHRTAATALAPDGKVVVAAGGHPDGRITVERFTPDGARDSSWGSSGKVSVNVGDWARVTGVAAADANSAFVTARSSSGGRLVLTVIKVTPSGVDSSFGTQGVARIAVPGKDVTAHDLAVLASGKVLLAGEARPSTISGTADTLLARLEPTGTPDPAFGSGGIAIHNLSGGTGNDYAAALAPLADGGLVTAGPATGVGAVARFTSAGALDPGFGDGGKVVGGLMPAGSGYAPVDVAVDPLGRPVVAGTAFSGFPVTFRWGIARLTDDGSPTLDSTFSTDGRTFVAQCDNKVGAGPTGVTLDGESILVLGACQNTARTALARLIGGGDGGPPAQDIELSVAPGSGAAGHERIPLAKLDPSAALKAAEDAQAAALRRTALRRTALRRTDVASTALRRTALRRTGLLSTALAETALRRTLLSEIALRRTGWEELLGVDVPLQTLTLEDALGINPAGVGALTLDDIDLSSTALRRTSMAALLLGQVPLASLPEPDGGWCSFLAGQPYDCSNGADPAATTLLELELLGDDLSAYYEEPISLRETELGTGDGASPMGAFLLRELDLTIAPFADAKAAEFASVLNCGACEERRLGDLSDAELGSATLVELIGLLPKPSLQDLSVGDVVLAVLDPDAVPYEALDLDGLLGEAEFRDTGLMAYDGTLTLNCGSASSLELVFAAPGDARPVPGGATISLDGGAAQDLGSGKPSDGTKSGPFVYDLDPVCAGAAGSLTARVELLVEPGSALGPIDGALLSVRGGGETVDSNEVTSTVNDSRDPGDELDEARPLGADALLTGHIASASDSDSFAFTPAAGRTTIELSHLPGDYDLVVYGPETGPDPTALRRTALRRTALRRTAVEDGGDEPTDEAIVAPDQIQDIALRRTGLAVRTSSIQRGTADEAASVLVAPEEAGQTFVAQVVGYNGAAEAGPYVVRRTDAPAAPAPACPARSLGGEHSIPYPESVPASTRALYLVAPGRMAARDGEAATASAMAKLDELADETDGAVVPVDNHPDISTGEAFAGWDAEPCSIDRANEVVTRINEIVDDVRSDSGGLPELRSIVLIGPDEVLPQARVQDRTVIGNESDYADDATLDRNADGAPDDNSVSAAFRNGYMLSDDPYGDFDPMGWGFAPDVALGRLVETPAQIKAQAQSFLDSDGIVEPQRAFVTGYDFLADGALDIFSSLEARVGAGAAQSRVDESWTADDALAGLNAAGAGFLSVNAHYDHSAALPAATHAGTAPDFLLAADATVPAGSAVFTVGCHAGLNLAIGDASSGADERLGDWAEQMATRGALYAANTGFGYGDDSAVAYSERVMAEYADGLASGEVTAGQALMLAKQRSLAAVGVPDVYWSKASMEATFYGLPMYRVGADGGEGAGVVPPLDLEDAGLRALSAGELEAPTSRSSTPIEVELRDRFNRVDTDRGSYWQVDDEDPLVVQRRPIQPKTVQDVTSEDGPAHGFLLESLTTADFSGIDPVVAGATLDLAEHEPEPDSEDPFFPATIATVEPQATAEGRRDMLTLMAGSFRGDRQRLNLEMGGRVLRSSSDDFVPPTITRVDGLVAGDGFSVRVDAEGDDLLGGTLLYITNADEAAGGELEWHRVELSVIAPGILSAGGPLPSGSEISEALVQVYDTSYNVAYSNKKVEGYALAPLPEPEPGDPTVRLTPATPASGYYSAPPQVSLDAGEHGDATFEVSVDGGAFRPDDGPFTIGEPAEGEHLVVYRGSDDSLAIERFAVDRSGPTIIAEADRPANANGWYDGPVTVSFTCADAVAGVADCPDPVTLSSGGANQTASGTATDRAGNSSTATVNGINIDRTLPTVDITTAPGSVLKARKGRLRGLAFDALSGVRLVRVTYRSTNVKQTIQRETDPLTCGTTGQCTWSAPSARQG